MKQETCSRKKKEEEKMTDMETNNSGEKIRGREPTRDTER